MICAPRITEAVTWQLIADLIRRHEAKEGLAVVETHPGGGQYDCRTLFRPKGKGRAHFNLRSGAVHIMEPFGEPREPEPAPWVPRPVRSGRLPYVEAVLLAPHRMEVVRHLEALLGLPSPKRSPRTTRHGLVYRMMAEIAARSVLDGPEVRWENGRIDTTDWAPEDQDDAVRPDLHKVQQVDGKLLATEHTGGGLLPGQRFWIWTSRPVPGGPTKPVAILDLDAMLYWAGVVAEGIDLATEFDKHGRSLPALASLKCLGHGAGGPGPRKETLPPRGHCRPPLTAFEVLRVLRNEVSGEDLDRSSSLERYRLWLQSGAFSAMHFESQLHRPLRGAGELPTLGDAIEQLEEKVAP